MPARRHPHRRHLGSKVKTNNHTINEAARHKSWVASFAVEKQQSSNVTTLLQTTLLQTTLFNSKLLLSGEFQSLENGVQRTRLNHQHHDSCWCFKPSIEESRRASPHCFIPARSPVAALLAHVRGYYPAQKRWVLSLWDKSRVTLSCLN